MNKKHRFSISRLLLVTAVFAVGVFSLLFLIAQYQKNRISKIVMAELESYDPQIVEQGGIATFSLHGSQHQFLLIRQNEAVLLLGVPSRFTIVLEYCHVTANAELILKDDRSIKSRISFLNCEFASEQRKGNADKTKVRGTVSENDQ